MNYEFTNIEAKWQKIWEEKNLYAATNGGDKEKFISSLTDNDREYFANVVQMQKTVQILKDAAVAPAKAE